MRPTSRTHALLALVLLAAAPAAAHSPFHLVCPRARLGGVKVDGNIAGWQADRFTTVDQTKASFGLAASNDDASFRFATMWDRWYLYVAIEVTDNSIVPAPTLARLYEGDCVEISIDAHNDSEGGYDATDFQFVICPTGPARKPRINLYRNPFLTIRDRAFGQVNANITPTGYVVEVAFRWRQLGVRPRPGHVAGFQINIRDYDADGSKKGLTWAPAADPAANPLRWGDLILAPGLDADVSAILKALRIKNARLQRLLAGTARELNNDVTVDIAATPAGRLALGLGWNVQFRDGRFPDWDDGTWSAFLELLAWTRPAWIRYGVNLGHWEPRNDNADPSHADWDAFTFRSKAMRHHYRVLDLCERNGIDVLWANWCIGDRATATHWLAESTHNPPGGDTDNDPFNDAPYDPEELAESLAACLHHLRNVRRYTCVKQVSLWNEPDQGWSYKSPSASYPAAFWTYYDALARHLGRLGLRDAVKILGPETSSPSYQALPNLAKALFEHSGQVDILAHHDYIGYADYHRIDRGVPMSQAATGYEELAALTPRPIAVTEFGNMGNGAGEVAGTPAIWAGSLSASRLVLEGLNAGVAGFLRWEFKPYGVSWQNFGALTSLCQRSLFEPHRPVFFSHALLCRAATRGADVLKTITNGGLDENGVPRVACTALHQRDTGTAILLVNDGFQPKTVTLRFAPGVPGGTALRFGHLSYDATLPETFRAHPPVALADGAATLTLEPRSLHALATRPDFTEDAPLPTLPPRDEPQYTTRDADGQTHDLAHMSFNADYDWRVWQSTAGATTFQTRPERTKPGNRVCRIAYNLVGVKPNERPEHIVAHTDLIVRGRPRSITFRVCGDAQRHRLAIVFLDARGEVFQHPDQTEVDWNGWQQVQKAIADFPAGWSHWSGDGKPDYPLLGFGFVLTAPDTQYRGRGILEMDDVEIASDPAPKPPVP